MNYSAQEAKAAALRHKETRRLERLATLTGKFDLQMRRIQETAERGEWGLFVAVSHGECQDFIWWFENQGFGVVAAPQIRQEDRNHIVYHITWS